MEKKQKLRLKIEKEQIKKRLQSLRLFPGNKSEYEDFIGGHKCRIIDTRLPEKYIEVYLNPISFMGYENEFQKRMVDEGIEALIHYSIVTPSLSNSYGMGIPIKRIK